MTVDYLPVVSRRAVWQLGSCAVLGFVTGCGTQNSDRQVHQHIADLTDLATRSREESVAATALHSLLPAHADTWEETSAARLAHADALDAEVVRYKAMHPISSTPTSPASPTTGVKGSGNATEVTAEKLVESLKESRQRAEKLALESEGFPAGLLASIAASISALLQVSFDFSQP